MQKCSLPGEMNRGDMEQLQLLKCPGQGRRDGKGPGLGQEEQRP